MAAGFILLSVFAAGCGADSGGTAQRLIDEERGTYEGVAIGKRLAPAVDSALGPRCEEPDNLAPCGVDAADVTAINSHDGDLSTDNRDGITLLTDNGWVRAFLTVDESATTARGVQVGDSLSEAETRYPGIGCDVQEFEGGATGSPYCTWVLPNRSRLIFGGEPIDSIALGGKIY
jgi:hypothetical protein